MKNNVWVVDSIRPEHTHELWQDHAEILSANRSVRSGIPEELKITGEMMRRGGAAAKTIDKTLTINAQLMGIPITWTRVDIQADIMPNESDRLYDATDLTQWLNERNANGLPDATVEEDGTLHACVFTLQGAIELFQKQGQKSCVIIDSTHNKNRLGLRLVSFAAMNENGHTKVKILHKNFT